MCQNMTMNKIISHGLILFGYASRPRFIDHHFDYLNNCWMDCHKTLVQAIIIHSGCNILAPDFSSSAMRLAFVFSEMWCRHSWSTQDKLLDLCDPFNLFNLASYSGQNLNVFKTLILTKYLQN